MCPLFVNIWQFDWSSGCAMLLHQKHWSSWYGCPFNFLQLLYWIDMGYLELNLGVFLIVDLKWWQPLSRLIISHPLKTIFFEAEMNVWN